MPQSPSRALMVLADFQVGEKRHYSLPSLTGLLASGQRDSSILWWVTKLWALDQSRHVGSQKHPCHCSSFHQSIWHWSGLPRAKKAAPPQPGHKIPPSHQAKRILIMLSTQRGGKAKKLCLDNAGQHTWLHTFHELGAFFTTALVHTSLRRCRS